MRETRPASPHQRALPSRMKSRLSSASPTIMRIVLSAPPTFSFMAHLTGLWNRRQHNPAARLPPCSRSKPYGMRGNIDDPRQPLRFPPPGSGFAAGFGDKADIGDGHATRSEEHTSE